MFWGGDVYFITGIVQSLKHMTMIKSELISGHFKNYCFKFSPDSARPYCPHLGPIAPTFWPLLHHWVIITLGWDWELEFLGVSLISACKWQFSVPNWEILISSLGLSFPNCKLRGPDRDVSQSSFLLQTLVWEVIFHQVEGDRGTHLECKLVSVQGAVLSYERSQWKEIICLWFTSEAWMLWLPQLLCNWEWSRGSFRVGCGREEEEEAMIWWGWQWWCLQTFTECLLCARHGIVMT